VGLSVVQDITALLSETLAEIPEIVGGVVSDGVYVTVMVSVPELPAASRAVTVMTLDPLWRAIPEADHEVVPVAVPLPPRLLVQVTCVTPTLSEAVPPTLSGVELAV
jgi:hypothetical protein